MTLTDICPYIISYIANFVLVLNHFTRIVYNHCQIQIVLLVLKKKLQTKLIQQKHSCNKTSNLFSNSKNTQMIGQSNCFSPLQKAQSTIYYIYGPPLIHNARENLYETLNRDHKVNLVLTRTTQRIKYNVNNGRLHFFRHLLV